MILFDKKLQNPVRVIKAFNNKEFVEAFQEIETFKNTHLLAGYLRYEAKDVFLNRPIKTDCPLLYFEVFDVNSEENTQFNQTYSTEFIFPTPSMTREEFAAKIGEIKSEIAQGNTYEVNYTYDHTADFAGDSYNLFLSLLNEQKTPYNAFIRNEYEEILSFSPELFFELENGKILTKPMKGTVKRSGNPKKDEENRIFLQNDIKNRAENVMIVDLLRNDLGRISKTGTVEVTKLFEIETHKTLHQMTSQIEAELCEGTTFYEIFEAIFPCGSITGAPKISTMEIIDRVEKGARNVYCGAIGYISPKKTVFSVPIRILQRKIKENVFKYRVGGAIVWDSTPEDEWEETLVKSKFLTANHDGLKLIETAKIEDSKTVFAKEHAARMKESARVLGFVVDEVKLEEIFNFPYGPASGAVTLSQEASREGILRVLMNKDGNFEVSFREFDAMKSCKIAIAEEKVNSHEPFLRHKTTFRPHFEKSFEKIKNGDIFDEIFFNEKDELTEGARSNIVVEKDEKFYTPPLECGLLNGIFRQNLLNEGKCTEKILKISDLEAADAIYCVNSVRGMVKVCF